jgi:hypothetical protein
MIAPPMFRTRPRARRAVLVSASLLCCLAALGPIHPSRAQVEGAVRGGTPPPRISLQDAAIIYRRAQAELTALRQDNNRSAASIETQLRHAIEAWLAKAADVPAGDPSQLTEPEREFARSMAAEVLTGKPAPVLKVPDSRFTDALLRTLLADVRSQGSGNAPASAAANPDLERQRRVDFARRRAKELAKINDDFRPDELAEIENVVDLSLVPESFKIPVPPRPTEPTNPDGTAPVTAPLRQRVFFWLQEVCTRVFPLIGGLDADARKFNLVKFIKDNHDVLGVAETAALELVEGFLSENPAALQPVTTNTVPTGTISVAPVITVAQPVTTAIPLVVVPAPRTRRCLSRW